MEQHARVKVTVAATRLGVSPWTLRRWIYAGKVPHIKTDTGRVFVPTWWLDTQTGGTPAPEQRRCALYARESSSDNKTALASQLTGLRQYAEARGYQIVHVVSEVASGMNDDRPKLHALLKRHDFDVLLVEHKERLSRFGFQRNSAARRIPMATGNPACGAGRRRSTLTSCAWSRLLAHTLIMRCA